MTARKRLAGSAMMVRLQCTNDYVVSTCAWSDSERETSTNDVLLPAEGFDVREKEEFTEEQLDALMYDPDADEEDEKWMRERGVGESDAILVTTNTNSLSRTMSRSSPHRRATQPFSSHCRHVRDVSPRSAPSASSTRPFPTSGALSLSQAARSTPPAMPRRGPDRSVAAAMRMAQSGARAPPLLADMLRNRRGRLTRLKRMGDAVGSMVQMLTMLVVPERTGKRSVGQWTREKTIQKHMGVSGMGRERALVGRGMQGSWEVGEERGGGEWMGAGTTLVV